MLAYDRSLDNLDDSICIQQAQADRYESMQMAMACTLYAIICCVSRCRRTVDHTGPYVRMLLERLRNPKSLTAMPPMPTAAGALEVPLAFLASHLLPFHSLTHPGVNAQLCVWDIARCPHCFYLCAFVRASVRCRFCRLRATSANRQQAARANLST